MHITSLSATGLLLALTSLPVIVAHAQPGSTPPTGVVNAIFNSVQSFTTGIFGGDLATGGILYVQNYIQNNKTGVNPLILNDGDGVQVTAGSSVFDVRTKIVNQQPGQFINIEDAEGVALNNFSVSGTSTVQNKVAGTPVTFNDTDGVRLTVGPFDAQGTITNTNAANLPVTITDPEGAVVNSGTWNLNTSFDLQGRLTNSSSTIYGGVVTVSDPEGFGVGNIYPGYTSAPQFKISADGDISHPGLVCGDPPACTGYSSVPLKMNDSQGLTLANDTGTSFLRFLPTPALNPTNFAISAAGAGESVIINDADGMDVSGPLFNSSAPLQLGNTAKGNQDIVINTHLRINGTLGTTYARSNTASVAAGANTTISAACDPGDQVVACGAGGAAGATSAFNINFVRLYPNWSDTCQAVGTNVWGTTRTFEVHAKCWNLDG